MLNNNSLTEIFKSVVDKINLEFIAQKDKENYNRFLILKNFQRQALHAYHIGFIHPTNKKFMIFESKFPEDIKNLLDLLLKY